MFKILKLQQLKEKTPEQLADYKSEALNLKVQLEELKAAGGDKWTDDMQKKLNSVALTIVDVEAAEEEYNSQYHPKPGTEQLVHAKIVRGRRFNPATGKEESEPFVQMFSYPEWQIFEKNKSLLGFAVLEVLYNPYNENK